MMMWILLLLSIGAVVVSGADNKTVAFELIVPEYKVKEQDAYVCTTIQLPAKPHKLVGVEPLAEQKVVHHILLFGCDEPFKTPQKGKSIAWDCRAAPTCGGNQETIMYGWGKNAPKLQLPKGVGFSVGGSSSIKWIVAQVHYLGDRPADDKSGVRLTLQENPIPYSAGLLSYSSWFSIPPGKAHHLVVNDCCYRGFQPLRTFAVRVHTHTMGRAVFMTRPKKNGTGFDKLAVGDPLAPQGFNPTEQKIIWPGDRLTVTCDFDSSKQTQSVAAGPTHEHEMCNMYLMVYSSMPHIEMCADGMGLTGDQSPGNMPKQAAMVPDPYPLWKPFDPKAKTPDGKGVFGNVASVVIGPDGMIWVLTRGDRVWKGDSFNDLDEITYKEPIKGPVVFQMHPDTGKILRSWGAGVFYMPHMITIDRDNAIWITDVGLHQALKFSDTGRLLMTIGTKLKPGHDKKHLCKPTQVDFMANGHILVSDGYCNSRAVRYTANGTWHCQYELPESGKKEGEGVGGGSGMYVAHSVLVQECDQTIWVADREGKKVHGFDIKSHKLTASVDLAAHGRVWSLKAGPYGRVLALCWDEGQDMAFVDVLRNGEVAWTVPNTTDLWPHDFALGAAPLALTGASDRLYAVYVAPLKSGGGGGPLAKYVMFPVAYEEPEEQLPEVPVTPVLSHLHGSGHGGAHQHSHQQQQEGDRAATDEGEGDEDGEREETEEEIEEEEKEEEKVDAEAAKEEEEKDVEEVKPEVVQQLQQKLKDVEQELKSPEMVAKEQKAEQERYETVYNRGYDTVQRSFWKNVVQIGVISAMLGTFVGVFAYHMMKKHVEGEEKQRRVAYSRVDMVEPSVARDLAEGEAMERDLLLMNGKQHRGYGNGDRV